MSRKSVRVNQKTRSSRLTTPDQMAFCLPNHSSNNGGGTASSPRCKCGNCGRYHLQAVDILVGGFPCQDLSVAGKGKVLLESDQAYGTNLLELLTSLSRLGLSLKMSPVVYPAKGDSTLPSSFNGWQNGGMAFPGGCLTLNITEWPNAAGVCLLSEVLETDVAPKYFLSPRACAGILRRAEKRGKALPPMLERSLKAIAAKEKTTPSRTPDKDTGMTMKQAPLFELLPAQAPTKPI
jgi:hypothetical protein